MNNTTLNSTGCGDTTLLPIVGTAEFPPLSQLPITPGQTMAAVNPADRYLLQRRTPAPPGQEDRNVQKDLNTLVRESEKMIDSGLRQAKHSHVISVELKILLENEKKILNNVIKRYEKFKQLKEENKQRTDDWNSVQQRILPEYEHSMLNLLHGADDSYVDEEGLQGLVRQKVLFDIVSKTAQAVKSISTHLSMETTIVNDIDLSLADLKQRSNKMLMLIGRWLPMLDKHDEIQVTLVERWGQIAERLKELREKAKALVEAEGEGGISKKQMHTLIQSYDDRISKLEQIYGELLTTSNTSEEYTSYDGARAPGRRPVR